MANEVICSEDEDPIVRSYRPERLRSILRESGFANPMIRERRGDPRS